MKTIACFLSAAFALIVMAAVSPAISEEQGQRKGPVAPAGRDRAPGHPVPPRASALSGTDWLAPGPLDMPRLGSVLGLTEEQKAAIKNLAERKSESSRPLIEQLPALYRRVSEIMLASAPDAAEAKSVVSQIRGIQEQLAAGGIDFWVGVRALLTPEQNAKLTETLKERISRGTRHRSGPTAPAEPEPEPETRSPAAP